MLAGRYGMAFHFTGRRHMAAQLRRIVRKELDAAVEDLRGPADAEAIHGARTSVKKVRAVLRLLEQQLGSRYEDENGRLQAAAHALASLRDADVTLQTLQGLQGRFPTVLGEAVVRTVGKGLRGRKRKARARLQPAVARARSELEQALGSVPRRIDRVADFRSTRAGAVRGYRQAREALAELSPDSGPARFHEWRKLVKNHGYHVRLFEGLHAGARARVRTLKRLEGWLGDAHDLAVLAQILVGGSDRFGNARERALVLGCIARSQAAIRRRALALGRRTFAKSPKEFADAVKAWRQR